MTTYEDYTAQFAEENENIGDEYEVTSHNFNAMSEGTPSVHYFNKRSLLSQYKKGEKGYYSVEYFGKKGEKRIFDFYETGTLPKTTIRNAVTGDRQRGFYVGSNDENLFFKVMNSTASLKNREPYMLFYENPEQWEKHTGTVCPTSTKDKWANKFQAELKKRKYSHSVRLLQHPNVSGNTKYIDPTNSVAP